MSGRNPAADRVARAHREPSRRFPDLPRRQGSLTPGGIRASVSLPNLREGPTLPQVTNSSNGAAFAQDHRRLPSPQILEPAGGFPDRLCRQRRATRGGIRASVSLPNLREGPTLPQVTNSSNGAAFAQDHRRLPSPQILEPAGGFPDRLCRQRRATRGGIRASVSLPNLREGPTLPQVTNSSNGAAFAQDHRRLPSPQILEPAGGFPDRLCRQRRATRGGIRASVSLPNLREGPTLPQVTNSSNGAAFAQDHRRLPSPQILEPAGGVSPDPAWRCGAER